MKNPCQYVSWFNQSSLNIKLLTNIAFWIFCLPIEYPSDCCQITSIHLKTVYFLFFGRMVDCMTSCTYACSIRSVSSSNWATPQTPNKPQSSQSSTPCKCHQSKKLKICMSLYGKLNTYTFVSLIFVKHQFCLDIIAKSIHEIKCWWKQVIWPLYLIDCTFVHKFSYPQNCEIYNFHKKLMPMKSNERTV